MDVDEKRERELERELKERISVHGSRFQRLQLSYKLGVIRESRLLSHVTAEGTALDLGCGTGIVACMVALAFPRKQVVGIDANPRRIEQSRRLARGIPNVTFVEGDLRRLVMPPAREVICLDVLHHLAPGAQEGFVQTAAAGLEIGGRFILFEVDTNPHRRWKYWMSVLADYVLYPTQEKAHYRSTEAVLDLFGRANLEPEEVLPLSGSLVAPILYVGRRVGHPRTDVLDDRAKAPPQPA